MIKEFSALRLGRRRRDSGGALSLRPAGPPPLDGRKAFPAAQRAVHREDPPRPLPAPRQLPRRTSAGPVLFGRSVGSRRNHGPQARRRHCHRAGAAVAGCRLCPGQNARRPADRGNAGCLAGPGPRRPPGPGQRQKRCGARGGFCPAPRRPRGHRDGGIRRHAAGARSPQRGHRQQRRAPGRHPRRGTAGTRNGTSSRPCTWGTTARASGWTWPSGQAPSWGTRCTCTWWATGPSGRRWRSWRGS